MVFIAFLGTVISDIDRINFGVATPTLTKGFGLRTVGIKVRKSAYCRSYTVMMLSSGVCAWGASVHDGLIGPRQSVRSCEGRCRGSALSARAGKVE